MNSQRANSVFSNNAFAIKHSYDFILNTYGIFFVSPPQTLRHTAVKTEVN